ncbi:MAG: DUF4091 domain-containing protein [Coriobacteriaceae bacterium]|nr:DUF4091 domain-containing protein [Coriobacteriaceae bacterium]
MNAHVRKVWKGVAACLALFGVMFLACMPTAAQAVKASGTDVVIDDTDARWSYSDGDANHGGWTAGGSGSPESTEHWANNVGATVDISFEGTGLELYGIKAPNHRYMSVQIDDGKTTEVDCYAAQRAGNQKLFAVDGLTQGAHVAHVKVLDKANPSAASVLGVSLQYAVAKGYESTDPVKDFNAFVGDEKLLDIPDNAYNEAKTNTTAEWRDAAWLGDTRLSKIGVATRDHEIKDVMVEVGDFVNEGGAVIDSANVDVNWLREVAADANRGMSGKKVNYPDVIYYPNNGFDIPAETLAFAWLNINVPTDAAPGVYTSTITVKAGETSYEFTYTLEVINLLQPTAQEVGYSVQLWQHPFSATGYYFGKSDIWGGQGGNGLWGATVGKDAPLEKFLDEDFRQYYKGILTDYAAMGGDDFVANIVDEAWGHQCYYSDEGMVTWTKTADGWEYDYTLFDQWVEFGIECGVIDPATDHGKIKCYSMIPWNNRVTYTDATTGEIVKKDLKPLSKEWKEIWTPFLEDFIKHLEKKGWFDITYIAFDERPAIDGVCKFIKEHKNSEGKALKTAAAINYAPDQVGEDQYLDDISVGQKHVLSKWDMNQWYAFVDARREKGLETTMYTCTGDYPNSSQQADPGDTYWSALYSQTLHTDGYLRWALDAWTNDMYGDTTFNNWEPGDPWFIYPLELGKDGVYDPAKLAENPKGYYSSPRYEMFKQGIRDVCKARFLVAQGGDMAAQVTALFDGMKFPNGSNNIPSSEADRMLTHSESDRVYTGLTEISRAAAPEVPEPEPEPVMHTVTFDDLIKQTENVTVEVEEGTAIDANLVPQPTCKGYTFEGWFLDAGYTKAFDPTAPVMDDMTVIAKWTKNEVPVDPDPEKPGDKPAEKPGDKPGDEMSEGGLAQTGDPASMLAFAAAAGAVLTGMGVTQAKRRK